MNSRERILAVSVGGAVGLIVLFWSWSMLSGMYKFRSTEIAKLEQSLAAERRLERQTIEAQSRMRNYEDRSLPPVPSVARSAYQTWLIELFDKADMSQPIVTVGRGKEEKNLFTSQLFTVHGKGPLPQVVKLLHGFYRADFMHRITKLNLKPIKDSKDLDLILDVEILSLDRAPPTAVLKERPSERLALAKQEDYVRIISERNIFGPPNRPPQLAAGEQKAIRGRSVDIAVRGSDPDKLDKLSYKLVKSGATDARLDPTSGKLAWTPRTNGKYEFLVRATDDGWPAKSSKDELLVVTVEDPPPEPPKRLAFDDAKFTVLTAVIDMSGTGQVWLSIRPKGQTLKLGVGDKFEVGSVKGTVVSIGDGDFTFESDGKEHKLTKGGILEQAVSVPQ
jgi:hypothetical protein